MARRARRHDPQPSPVSDLPVWIVRGVLAGIAATLPLHFVILWSFWS
ncbi:hypothetical protein [Ensifer sp. ZNC0028]|nr:hypothetical protein [Ensifer sp. ZNC0028]